ncbi:LOW QUALITY PROTEIN: transmembrane protein 69 [Emydura macquarii macquarii]|uniref:LOW QUALITY PROTEIN: transmembrane protein 69 n=1 Tax=Emydura macquarii macquarii TaxID=1129001 RepID=UPI00352A287F
MAHVLGWGSASNAHEKKPCPRSSSFPLLLGALHRKLPAAGPTLFYSLRFPWAARCLKGPSAKANMFHLVQRCCSHTPLKVQKLTLQRLPQYGRNKTTCSSPRSLPLQRRLPHLSRSQLLSPASACVTKAQGFHSSLPCLKKEKPEEAEPQLDFLRSVRSLKDLPKSTLYLGIGGLIPFVSVPLIMAIQQTYDPELAFVQITYGAAVVSFIGGIRWGVALPENSPAKSDWLNLANSIVPPFVAWCAVFLKDNFAQAALLIILSLGIALHYDLVVRPLYPTWFKGLRILLTGVAVFSLIATVDFMNVYPEKQLNNSANKSK